MNDDNTARITDMPDDPGSLDGVVTIRLDCNDIELKVEGDASLSGVIRLVADRSANAPAIVREGDEMVVVQRGRYRGSAAVLRVPERDCPPITGRHDRGAMSFETVNADVSLEHGMGDLRVVGGHGTVELASGRGDITVDHHTGDMVVKAGNGDLRLGDTVGAVVVSLGRGDMALAGLTGQLVLKSGSGDVSAIDCGGALVVKTGSGDIAIGRPRELRVDSSTGNGDVSIRGGSLTGLRVRSGRGNVSSTATLLLSRAGGDDDVSGSRFSKGAFGEDIEDDPFGIASLLESKGLEFIAGEQGVRIARGPFEFEASDAGVRIGKGGFSFVASDEGVRIVKGEDDLPGNFDVQTAKGDIAIDVPGNVPTRVETIINSGDVHSDIPLVSVGRPGPRGTTQRFVGVSGSPSAPERLSIKLKTNRGDIRIRAVAQPTWPAPPAPPRPPQPPAPVFVGDTRARTQEPGQPRSRDERMRSILDALARGDLSVNDAERLLAELERD